MLVTISKGRLQFLTVNLISTRVLQFETLGALTIMLEVEGAMEEV